MVDLPERPDLSLIYAHRGPIPEADALGVHGGVTVRRLPLSPRAMLAAWYKARLPVPIEAVLGRVHVMHGPDFVLPPRISAAGVVTIHDLAFVTRPQDADPSQRRFLEAAVPLSIDRARIVVTVSQTTRRDLMARLGVRPHRIRVVPNAVSQVFQIPDTPDQLAEVRNRLKLPDAYLLSVGAIHPRKNIAGVARAAAIVSRRLGRGVPVLHVGREGWLCEHVFAGVEAAGPPGVRFIGQVDDPTLRALYRQAAAVVYVSFEEGFGIPILEAFACEVPVVTSDRSGTLETAGDAAVLVDPADDDSMAEGILGLLDGSGLREDLIQRGKRRLADYSWSRAARRMLQIYAEAQQGEPLAKPVTVGTKE